MMRWVQKNILKHLTRKYEILSRLKKNIQKYIFRTLVSVSQNYCQTQSQNENKPPFTVYGRESSIQHEEQNHISCSRGLLFYDTYHSASVWHPQLYCEFVMYAIKSDFIISSHFSMNLSSWIIGFRRMLMAPCLPISLSKIVLLPAPLICIQLAVIYIFMEYFQFNVSVDYLLSLDVSFVVIYSFHRRIDCLLLSEKFYMYN